MVNKKYLLLAGLCSLLAVQPARAQESETATASWGSRDMTYRGEGYDVLDSSYYPKGRLDQYRRYMNHQTPFPPKPSNQWEIGLNVGLSNVLGDVTSRSVFTAKKATDALGFGLTVRKALGYFMSVRLQWVHARATGLEYRTHNANERPWSNNLNAANTNGIYQNYRTKLDEVTLQLVGAINNIRFHKAKNTMSLYGLLGGGFMTYDPMVNALNEKTGNTPYDFTGIAGYTAGGVTWDNRKPTYEQLENLMDDSYESSPGKESHQGTANHNVIPVLTTGLGLQFRLSSLLTLQLEDKITFTFRDMLDGSQLQNNGSITSDKDLWNYASLGLNFNIGNKRKNVAPLWWVNPLDHAYSELSDPRHMRLPEPILPDSDGDGVADQFDKCPGTPAGVAVDTHGCPMDTDGDGVPDYKDKQLITPTECQPVDADGVGKCPCPDGCGGSGVACGNIGAGSLNFTGSGSRITPGMQSQLSNLAAQMQANPTCKVVIIGAGNSSKAQQQRSWDRVNAVIEYMSEKHGIDRNRFIFQYGAPGDENGVMYRSANAGEEGPANVAPPFPNLRRE
jgi:OmpA-OmpF porin, OOP family